MTDGQWALLAPLLPAAGSTGGRGGRPEKWDRRLVLDAQRCVNVRVWPTGAAQCRPRP